MENQDLIKKVLAAKTEVALLRRRKRVLLEEVHRQCLEGELDPRKRQKQMQEKIKKAQEAQG
jgi:hypothetical protein